MNNHPFIKQGWLRAIVGLIIVYPVIDNAVYVVRLVAQPLNFTPNRLAVVANNLVFATLAIYLVRKFVDRKSFLSLGLSIRGFAKDILFGFAGSPVIMSTGFLILYSMGNIRVISFNFDFVPLLYGATVFIFAAALEEISFRGYLLSNMMESMNGYIAVGIISVMFGFGHAAGQNASIIGLINCTLLGVLVGLYYVHKRNLWLPITFHTGWNFFQGTIFGFSVSGRSFDYSLLGTEISGSELITGGKVGFEGSLILTVLTILMIAGLGAGLLKQDIKRE